MKTTLPCWLETRHRIFVATAVLALPLLAPAQSVNDPRWIAGGHAREVRAVAFSPDGRMFGSASDDATVKLWSTNGTLLQTLSTHPYPATALAFSPDGNKLAVGTYAGGYRGAYSGLGRVFLWQAVGGWHATNVILTGIFTNHLGKVTALAFSANGANLASGGSEGSNVVRQLNNGAVLTRKAAYNTTTGPAAVASLTFSPAGTLASGCEDNSIRAWNSSWTQIWSTNTAHASNVTAVAFSPAGDQLASASLDQTIRLWTTTNWLLLRTLTGQTGGVTSISFSPDGSMLAAGSVNGFIRLWDLSSGICLSTINTDSGAVWSVVFSPDGARLVSGGQDNEVKMWSPTDGALIQACHSHDAMIRAVAVSPDGTLCASAGDDHTIQIRSLIDGALVRILSGHTGCVSAIAFAPESTVLASAGGPLDATIKLWQLGDGTVRRTIPANTNGVTALAFSRDGTTLASGGDYDEKTIQLWSASDGSLLQTLAGHSNGVSALAFSRRGDLLASGGRRFDHTVKVWALTNGGVLRTFTGHAHNVETVAFSADGDTVASGSSGTNALKVWQISDGSSRTFGGETNPVYFVAFSPDSSTLASAGKDAIKLWNVGTGSLSQTITQETFRAMCLAYSPNGNLLVYGREDATLAASANTLGALPQQPLEFTRLAPSSGGNAALEASVQPGTHYVIQSSTHLTDWTNLTVAVSDTHSLSVTDISTNDATIRFYRAFAPP